MSQCESVLVTASTAAGRDTVRCEKPAGHKKKPEHSFHYVGPRRGDVERWTDEEAKK